MATICLLSAKGSPGVTTTMVGLTLAWSTARPGRRALGLDADPIGGDVAAGVLRGGAPTSAGVLPLATARGVGAVEAIEAATVQLRADGSAGLVPGIPDAARAGALVLAWDRLAEAAPAMAEAGVDLLVDAGRVDLQSGVDPWLLGADLALLVVRPTLPAVTAARRLVTAWLAPGSTTSATPLRLVVVAQPSAYGAHEVASAAGLPLLAELPFEPVHASVHSAGAPGGRSFARSAYVRALQRCAGDVAAEVLPPLAPAAAAGHPQQGSQPATATQASVHVGWGRLRGGDR